MYKISREYPKKKAMRTLSEQIFKESKTARTVYLDCKDNVFVVADKLKDTWRFKEIGRLDPAAADSLYNVLMNYRKSKQCVCKSTAKKLDGSQAVLNASFVGTSQNPHFRSAADVCWYDKNVMLYHSKKMQDAYFMQKLEKELNTVVNDLADEIVDEY